MRIEKDAVAGTLESSDAQVKVSPHNELEVTINSSVAAQFGDEIKSVVDETLQQLQVSSGTVTVEDKGALDCTLRARVQAAVTRASGEDFDWSTL